MRVSTLGDRRLLGDGGDAAEDFGCPLVDLGLMGGGDLGFDPRHSFVTTLTFQPEDEAGGTAAPAVNLPPPMRTLTPPPPPPLPPPPPPPPPRPIPFREADSRTIQFEFDRTADGRLTRCAVVARSVNTPSVGQGDCAEVASAMGSLITDYCSGEAMSFRVRYALLAWTSDRTMAIDPQAVAQLVAVFPLGDGECFKRTAGDARFLPKMRQVASCAPWTNDAVPRPTPDAFLDVGLYAAPPGEPLGAGTPVDTPAIPTPGQRLDGGEGTTTAPPAPPPSGAADELPDRFVVVAVADRLSDGTMVDCRFEGMPGDGCGTWTDGDEGPALFARTHRPGEALRFTSVVDVRPWTGFVQATSVAGQVEQVVLLGGEGDNAACARVGEGGPVMSTWSEVTACPLTADPAAFFRSLGDPRPRQSTWTLTARPMTVVDRPHPSSD